MPTGATAKRPKVSICCASGRERFALIIRSFNMISGLEPTMVSVPPRMAQNPIGMSSRESGKPVRAEIRETTGRNRAVAPTFCMNEEVTPTTLETIVTIRFSARPPTRRMRPASSVITPVLSRPPPRIITAMIETTALLENPENSTEGLSKSVRPGIASPNSPRTSIISTVGGGGAI
jgi:hypothetical protein